MQCPRCGLQNLPDITACARCGLAVWPAQPPAPDAGQVGSASGRDTAPVDAPSGGYGSGGYGSGGYGSGGYGSGGYEPPAGYGAPPGPPPYAQPSPQQYSPTGPSTSAPPPPYRAPYGPSAGSPYSTGPVSPYGATAVLPAQQPGSRGSGDMSGRLARLLMLLGVVACVGYAIWAMTARRGIFADFADNRSVSLDDAKTSDQVDTVFLVVAGAVAVIALALWLIRLLSGRARNGVLTVAGLVISALGLACVVVGLVLSGLVGDGSRIDEGQQAVTATIVTGSGFIALAVGLLIGSLVVGRSGQAVRAGRADGMTGGPAGW